MAFNERWITAIHRFCSVPTTKRVTISNSIPKNLHTVNPLQNKRQAAVLVPLCNQNGLASVVFTKRTDTVGTHKGQVSFPGGHLEPNETPIEAAIREAYEELGSSIGNIKILGICQTIPAITGTLVTPVIGYFEDDIRNFENFTPNESEVSRIFAKTLEELQSPTCRWHETLSRGGISFQAPTFGAKDDVCRIWGLTAMILDAVLTNVIIPTENCGCRVEVNELTVLRHQDPGRESSNLSKP